MGAYAQGNSVEIGSRQGGCVLSAVKVNPFSPHAGEGKGVQGSLTNLRRPAALSVCASNVRISVVPPTSSVTTTRSPATPVETIFAPLGRTAVSPAVAILPSERKRR